MQKERRYRVCYIDHQYILDILNNTLTLVDFDVPDDAHVVYVFEDSSRLAVGIVIESKQFDPVPLGVECPQLPPIAMRRKD